MKHILILLLLFSFSAFAYDNPYRDQKNWEAEKRYNGEFQDGRQANYWNRQFDNYERESRNAAEVEAHRNSLDSYIRRDRSGYSY